MSVAVAVRVIVAGAETLVAELASETAGYSKQALEDGAAHFEKLLGVKSLDGAVQAQSEFLKSSYEKAIGQATRFGELYVDAVKHAAKPFEGLVPMAGK